VRRKPLDGRPLYRRRPGATTDEIERRKALYFAPYHLALVAEIQAAARLHPRVVRYDATHPFEGAAAVSVNCPCSISAQWREELRLDLEAAVFARRCAARPWSNVVNGRVHRRLDHPPMANPAEGVHARGGKMESRCAAIPQARPTAAMGSGFRQADQQTRAQCSKTASPLRRGRDVRVQGECERRLPRAERDPG